MQVSNLRLSAALIALGLAVSSASQAALFDDTEARKRILELENKQTSEHDAQQKAITDLTRTQQSLDRRVQSLEALINGKGLLDMQNQLEQIRQDVAQLKGDLEVVTHQLEDMRTKQSASYTDLDTRVRKLETLAQSVTSGQMPVTSTNGSGDTKSDVSQQESTAFAEAESLNQAGKYKEAFNAYDAFLKSYSGSKLAPDALYGMGYTQFALKSYKSSAATQQKFLDSYATHALAPNAMLNLANSQIQLGQIPAAKKTLKDLIAAYPSAEVTPSAQKRLKVLESIK
ncbi:MAG: tol-pal system protein [Methylotenera sp.]|jgi:tol-pal system protein YbgF|uniref:YbgF trimerization domain-containing protein n=1 Tax=Methylophilaceae TaxID=32011 RepID=UPI000D425C9E|nr:MULTISPECIES: YbgF trimerization domain-containing protein [Methylophilaceae]PPC83181.1 MAG: tol-pal system protein [Methylotenera sp.]TXI43369.1 MAG: tetratricopeptide repeat protein [Methylophilus sp.]